MSSDRKQLRAQIKMYKEFLDLCEEIKKLEKQQDGRLEQRKANLEAERIQAVQQIAVAEHELQKLVATVESTDRPIAVFEKSQIEDTIRSVKIRLGTLRNTAESAVAEISRIDEQARNNNGLLEALYSELEQRIAVSGLDPNTAQVALDNLTQQMQESTSELRADVASAHGRGNTKSERVVSNENTFFAQLILDISQAKTSIEIVSPNLGQGRSADLLAALAERASRGLKVMVYVKPINEQDASVQKDAQALIVQAHTMRITMIQRSGIKYNAVIVDGIVSWEGDLSILGTGSGAGTMRRDATSSHVRELRHFLFSEC